jgi:cation diffusion facilitator family transporter
MLLRELPWSDASVRYATRRPIAGQRTTGKWDVGGCARIGRSGTIVGSLPGVKNLVKSRGVVVSRASQQESSNHDHTFGEHLRKPGEPRTLLVVLLTAATMVLEVAAGIKFGSMALLADGLHMASHATALAIAMFAYIYARRHAHDSRFSFGTGKVNSLAGFTGAVLLAVFALIMVSESVKRLFIPITIAFDQALVVACIGLFVNGLSVVILGHPDSDAHGEGHDRDSHEHDHDESHRAAQHAHDDHHAHAHDHNLRSAYLHVLADALTSVLAILALLAGKLGGLSWLDPVMGVVGAVLVARWSIGLVRTTSRVLLDRQGPDDLCAEIRSAVELTGDTAVTDLHLWTIAPGKHSLILVVTTDGPHTPESLRQRLPRNSGIVHIAIEVNRGAS